MKAPLVALNIRQPYANQIIDGSKTIEYRSIPTKISERVYIYASKTPDPDEDATGMPRGVIIGTVEIVGCEKWGDRYQWAMGRPEWLEIF